MKISYIISFSLISVFCRVTLQSSSVCVLPSGQHLNGSSDCSTGEVQLLGQYLNVGIHNCGSFGTESVFSTSYYNNQLGILSDFDQNGMASVPGPGHAGDYSVPGSPIEGSCY